MEKFCFQNVLDRCCDSIQHVDAFAEIAEIGAEKNLIFNQET
jgi:hypothetical protein